MSLPIWLDCDPGHDDAMAIVLAGYNSKLNLLGISTCHGNQSHDKTLRNAALFVKAAGLTNIRIIPGQDKPIMRKSLAAPDIHGESGLDGTHEMPVFDPRFINDSEKAVPYLSRLLLQAPTPVTLVATGPLTNYGLLLTLYPEVIPKIKKIVFMGGSIGPGNYSAAAEFNILVDPEAAHIVFNSGVHVCMVPLEVSHTAIVTDRVLEQLDTRCKSSPFSRLVIELLLFFKKTYEEVFQFNQGPPLHDPCTIAYLIAPEIFTVKTMGVDVVTDNGPCLGQTVCDIYGRTSYPKIDVTMTMDPDAFFRLMLDAWVKADGQSPMNQSCHLKTV